MSELEEPFISKQLKSESPRDPVLEQPKATLNRQPFDEAHFLKVLKELEAPFPSIVKNFESVVVCSCSCELGLIVGLEDGSVVVVGYDAEVQVLGKHGGKVYHLCTNKDVVVSGSLDTTICIWSLETQSQLFLLKGHTSSVYCVSLSSDGKFIASGSEDKTVRVWDIEDRTQLSVFEGHTDYVWRVSITPDGQYIVSGSNDKTVRIWSFKEKRQLAVLVGHNNRVNSILISPDSKHIISRANENTIRIWSLEDRKEVTVLEGHIYSVLCEAMSLDGKVLFSGSADHTMRIWSLEAKKELAVISAHSDTVNCISISGDEKWLLSGSDDNTLRLWDLEERKLLAVLEGHTAGISHLSISHDGKQVISISWDKVVRIWTLENKPQFDVLEGHRSDVVSISSNGNQIVSGSWDKTLRIWDLEERKELAVLEGHSNWVFSISISANGEQIASASADKTVRIWDFKERKVVRVIEHLSFVYCVAISYDGKKIITGSGDNTVQIWDLTSNTQLANLHGHTSKVWCVSISLDDKYIVSGSWDKTLRLWSFEERTEIAVLEGHTNSVYCVSISTNGKFIVSGAQDKTVRIWDMEGRTQLAILEGHTGTVSCVAISLDSRHIASGATDKTVRIWDLEERKLLAVLEGHSGGIQCVSLTTDGSHVLSGSKDKTIRIVDLTMMLPSLRSEFLNAHFDNKEPAPSKTYYFCGKYQDYLKQGIAIASSVASSPILPHYFNSLHICAYYNQSTALKDYLEQRAPIIRGVFGSPLTVALTKDSTKCINVILQYLINTFESKKDFLVLQEIVEDFPKLLVCNALSLVPFFSTLLGTPTQSLPEYIVPLRELPCALFQPQQLIYLPDFAQFEGKEIVTQSGELVKFWISRFNWNFELGSAASLEFLRALEDCENKHILTTPLVNSLIQFKWERLLLITRTHTLLYICLLVCLVCLTFNYLRQDLLSFGFLCLNVLFLLYEVVQSLANRSDYWKDAWHYLNLIRGITSVVWGYLVFSEVEAWPYLQFFVVLLCYLRGFTFFRTFKMTRMFVRMVLEVVKEMYAFLVILAYSTVSFGMMYAVLMPELITDATDAWTSAYELLMGTHDETDFDLPKWLWFTAASLMNVIIMLNLLISILGDAYEKAQMSASEHDNLEMIKIVIEYESMLFWRRKAGKSSVMVVCTSAEEEDSGNEWAGRVKTIKNVVEKNLKVTESLLLKKLDDTEKTRKDDESASIKKCEENRRTIEKLEKTVEATLTAMEEKLEKNRTTMEEKLEATRTALEAKIDQVLAAIQASH